MSAPVDRRTRAAQLLKQLSSAADSIDDYLKTTRSQGKVQVPVDDGVPSLETGSQFDQEPQTADETALNVASAPMVVSADGPPDIQASSNEEVAIDGLPDPDHEAPVIPSHSLSEPASGDDATMALEGDGVVTEPVIASPSEDDVSPAVPLSHLASTSTSTAHVERASEDIAAQDSAPVLDAAQPEGPVDEINQELLPIVAEEIEELTPQVETLLRNLIQGDKSALPDLHRYVHTIKGNLGMVGAMRLRAVAHSMESLLDEALAGTMSADGLDRVLSLFEGLKDRMDVVLFGRPAEPVRDTTHDEAPAPPRAAPRVVRVQAAEIDRMVAENNEARLAGAGMSTGMLRLRAMLAELQENVQRQARVQRDLEIQAESQIQSRRAQLAESGQEFDPLEMDRFTRLQETSRFLAEGVSDASDIYRDLARHVAAIEALMVEQEGAIAQVGSGLARTRLVPVDAINDRLYQVVWRAARELDKQVEFRLAASSGQVLDRMILDALAPPLEHILRNSVAHGIETPAQRRERGKPETGTVTVSFRQVAGRLVVEVDDDGAGLDSERIRSKAVERGLWEAGRPMDDQAAADMICAPGFSTADNISQLAGRGVGMDVVREDVLKMGGRFSIVNRAPHGLQVVMFLPLSVAAVSAAAVEAAGEQFALPVETVEHTLKIGGDELQDARQSGRIRLSLGGGKVEMPYSDLSSWLGLSDGRPSTTVTLLVLREGDRRLALGADKMLGISELPQRPLGAWWSGMRGVMGAVLLPSGRAAFLVDPLRMGRRSVDGSERLVSVATEPVVMVVDDSITVRKVAARFLERHGFRPLLARDGREALEMMVDQIPDAILMDVEMPRMDGFDCVRHIRENPKLAGVPVAMITSRTAEKHRRRATELGVDAYFGKPFREEDVLKWLGSRLSITP